MSTETIQFYDGNTGELVSTVPSEQVPPPNREVYYRGERLVPRFQQGDRVVPVARVVKTSIDHLGRPVTAEEARFVRIEEFDSEGRLLRTTRLERSPATTDP